MNNQRGVTLIELLVTITIIKAIISIPVFMLVITIYLAITSGYKV